MVLFPRGRYDKDNILHQTSFQNVFQEWCISLLVSQNIFFCYIYININKHNKIKNPLTLEHKNCREYNPKFLW